MPIRRSLVADDSAAARRGIAAALGPLGLDVEQAEDLASKPFDAGAARAALATGGAWPPSA